MILPFLLQLDYIFTIYILKERTKYFDMINLSGYTTMLKWNIQHQQHHNDKKIMWWEMVAWRVDNFSWHHIHAPNPPNNNLSYYKNMSPPLHLEDSYFLYPMTFQLMWKVILKTKVNKFVAINYFLILAEKSLPES